MNTFIFITLLAVMSCSNSNNKKYTSPKGYDLNHPQVQTMPDELKEISGIAFHHNENDELYAIQDELGFIYQYNVVRGDFRSAKFGKKGDYEDVAVYENTIIVLRSDGTIFTFPLQGLWNTSAPTVREFKKMVPKGEYESLAVNEETGELTILCKQCQGDRKKDIVSGYVLSINNDTIQPKNNFSFEVKQLNNRMPSTKSIVFKPSALTKNPLTNQWYIISAVNRLLVITDANWNVKEVHELNGKIFEQPEGIAFDKSGNLYISSEAGEKAAGTIMKFSLRK